MTEFNMSPSRECIGEYISLSISKNKGQKALKIMLYGCTALIAVLGIAMAIITKQPAPLLITLAGVLAGVAFPLIIHFFLKSAAEKTAASAEQDNGVKAAVSELNILMIKDGIPKGVLEWEDVSEIIEGKTGFFLITKSEALLPLAKGSVVSGTYDEAAQVLRAIRDKRNGKLSEASR